MVTLSDIIFEKPKVTLALKLSLSVFTFGSQAKKEMDYNLKKLGQLLQVVSLRLRKMFKTL